MLFGIDVIIIGPGAVVTPIWQKSDAGVTARFRDTPSAKALAKFERYAEEGRERLSSRGNCGSRLPCVDQFATQGALCSCSASPEELDHSATDPDENTRQGCGPFSSLTREARP